ncbi:MAG: PAS domain S-box protein [Candidatus Hydrogenedentes bacterium]|nr:PAS domain S-box protein [Candidatus Hydrogenedentota bacterium]
MIPAAELAHSLPVTVERSALIMRYLIALIIGPIFLLGYFGGEYFDFFVITGMVMAHNLYVHVVLWARAYRLFFTRTNFFIYLVQISIIMAITGGESSDAYLLYHLLIIGFSAYDRRFGRVITATLVCLAAYIVVILIEKYRSGFSLTLGAVVVRLLSTFIVGWMIASLSERLRRAEVTAAEQTAQIAASEATLRAILNSAGDPIVVFDDNEYIVEANERASEFLGVPRVQLVGQRLRAYLFDDGALPHKLADLRARGQAHTHEIALPRSGEERAVDMIARSFIREGVRYFIVLLRDVTYQKNIEEASRVLEARLEKLNTDLRQLDRHKSEFMHAISAGIRTPLAAVAGYVDMLIDGELGDVNPDQSKALQTCRRALQRVFRLVERTIDAYSPRFGRESTADKDAVAAAAAEQKREPK